VNIEDSASEAAPAPAAAWSCHLRCFIFCWVSCETIDLHDKAECSFSAGLYWQEEANKAKDAHYFSLKTSKASQCFMFHFVFWHYRQVL
jgi:hypothetical protein